MTLHSELVGLQPFDAPLIGTDGRRADGIGDGVEEAVDLVLDAGDLAAERGSHFGDLRAAQFPGMQEHLADEGQEALCGPHALEHLLEVAFKLVAPDGLAVARASLGVAAVIGEQPTVPTA
ncbi:MAG: hypothetical protein AAFP17_07915 [Pseudomonadota bacterium]